MRTGVFHGGASSTSLENAGSVVSADVLDAWFDSCPGALEKLHNHLPFLVRTSPPIYGKGLVQALAEARGVPEECLLVGAGSSDLIFHCLTNLIRPAWRVLVLDPMYSEYEHACRMVVGAEIVRHRLRADDGFRVDAEGLLADVERYQPDCIIVVNPNSPTGRYWSSSELLLVLGALPPTTLLIVDETYIEYVNPLESIERAVVDWPNLVIVKSMSKVYALSGLRVAYIAASPALCDDMARFLPPWAVSTPEQVAAIEALRDRKYYCAKYNETHKLRAEAVAQVAAIPGIAIHDTQLNFYLVELLHHSATEIVGRLQDENIFVRNCDSFSREFGNRFLRITVKDGEQNRRVAAALKQVVALSR